jgi:diguanylate cyclase (GGDEF)-like protein
VKALARFYHSFAGRLALAALGMHLVLALFLGFGISRIISEDLKDEFVNVVRSQSLQLGLSLEGKTPDVVRSTMQDWLLGGQVVYAELISRGGETISAISPGASGLRPVEDFAFGQHGDDVYFIAVPVPAQGGASGGTLRLGFDELHVRDRVIAISQRGLALVFAYLIAGLLLALLAGRLLGRSIRRLRDAARRVAIGHTDEELVIPADITEVTNLTQDLEFMRRELVRRRAELQTLAYFDGLTGLPNRVKFHERLAEALDGARDHNDKLALLYLDLDRFKRVNDTLGHGAGDQLLRSVAQRLQECLRQDDLVAVMGPGSAEDSVARLGGDEFVILLSHVATAADAGKVADRVLDALCEPISIASHQVYATTSIGIALYPFDGQDPVTLLKNADAAMYHAKQEGKNRFQYYMGSMNVTAATRLELESELHRAIDRDELVLHYQPQIIMATGELAGAEALLRWQHPARGLLAPTDFIQIAEESGLIVAIGDWVVRRACEQLRDWREAGMSQMRLSVNVSAKQFRQPGFARVVAEALSDFDVPRGALALEITETALMSNEEEAIRRIQELRALGVGLAIDDFGTGYSSLAYLRRFAAEALKIDRSFILDVPENTHNAAIVRAIIALAQSLNLNVIAEGVETRSQWEFLLQHGCDEVQGYLASRPLPAEAFVEYFEHVPHPQ